MRLEVGDIVGGERKVLRGGVGMDRRGHASKAY